MLLPVFLPVESVLGFQYTIIAEDLSTRGPAVAVVDHFWSGAQKRQVDVKDSDALTDDMPGYESRDLQQTLSVLFSQS